jgi:hypothetical protein
MANWASTAQGLLRTAVIPLNFCDNRELASWHLAFAHSSDRLPASYVGRTAQDTAMRKAQLDHVSLLAHIVFNNMHRLNYLTFSFENKLLCSARHDQLQLAMSCLARSSTSHPMGLVKMGPSA